MKRQVQEILRRYGQKVTLRRAEDERTCRAFLQPMTAKNEQVPAAMTELGSLDKRLWRYLGESAVEADDRLFWNGTEFRVRSSRPWYVGEEVLYWWAVLELAKETDV